MGDGCIPVRVLSGGRASGLRLLAFRGRYATFNLEGNAVRAWNAEAGGIATDLWTGRWHVSGLHGTKRPRPVGGAGGTAGRLPFEHGMSAR